MAVSTPLAPLLPQDNMIWRAPPHPLGDLVGSEEVDGDFSPVSIGKALNTVLALAEHAFRLQDECESPIEIMLGAEIHLRLGGFMQEQGLTLVPQWKLNPYRFDFAVAAGDKAVLFIECDGRDFHSSPEQRDHDRRKDQWANLHAKVQVLRFTGSQIHCDAAACVRSIHVHLRDFVG